MSLTNLLAKRGFWQVQNEVGAVKRFLTRLRSGLLVCDRDFAKLAENVGPAEPHYQLFPLASASDMDLPRLYQAAAGTDVFLFCMHDYTVIERVVSETVLIAGGRFWGFPHEIAPALFCYGEPWADTRSARTLPDITYTIVSTPRSGSTFLADILARNGLGSAKEHIRLGFGALWQQRELFGLDFRVLFEQLIRYAAKNNCFGTKIITEFYWALADEMDVASRAVFDEFIWSHPTIYLLRRSKIKQAVSDHIARALGVWHFWNGRGEEDHALKLAQLPYDFEGINRSYSSVLTDELRLREFMDAIPNVINITYEDLLDHREPLLRQIITSITDQPFTSTLVCESSLASTNSERNDEFCEKFKRDILQRQLYQELRDDPLWQNSKMYLETLGADQAAVYAASLEATRGTLR